jgi:hypothetical protein
LFEWDGTNGDFAIDAVNPAAITAVREITSFDDGLYLYMSYSPDDAQNIGTELYKYDVATDTYTLILDIAPGTNTTSSGAIRANNSGISNFTPFLNKLYFEALDLLYETDGTTTIEVPAAATLNLEGVRNLYKFDDALLFEADNGNGDQLFKLDTITGIISQISAIGGSNATHDPSDYAFLTGSVYYRGEDAVDNKGHLFRTDGITTTQLDTTVIDVDDVTAFNGLIYFEGEIDDLTGNEIFVFDPATASIEQLTGLGSIKIAQNPVTSDIHLTGETQLVKGYTIYDLSGRNVQSGTIDGSYISNTLKTGIYIIELQGVQGSNSLKFIKE